MTMLDTDLGAAEPGESSWLYGPAPAGSPADPLPAARDRGERVRLTVASTSLGLPVPASMLVLGPSGGGGVSSVAAGLAAALATYPASEAAPVLVDATPAGGDIAARAADVHQALTTVQTWLSTDEPSLPSTVDACCAVSSTGVGVLARDDTPLPRRETFASVHRALCDAGTVPVFDGGSPVSSRAVRPLLADSRIPVAIVLAARPDAVNRLAPVLSWLDDQFGEYAVGDCAIVLTHQTPYQQPEFAAHLRDYLDWVRGVFEIPYDPHLASGGLIIWTELAEATRVAYRNLLEELQR